MKIAITCPASLPATQFGGIMFLGVNIAKILSNNGNKVTIYTTDLDFANNSTQFNKKLPRIEKFEQFIIKRTHVYFSLFLFFINFGMYKQMKNDENDLIHAIGVRSFQSIIAAIISKKKNIPFIISDQGGLTTHPDLQKSSILKILLYRFQKPIIKFIIKQADKIIVPNIYERNIFLEFCHESKIIIIQNGIDLNSFKNNSSDFIKKYDIKNEFILFLGRFNKVKGIQTLIDSVNQIKNHSDFKNIKTVILGVDFGYQLEMEKMIKKLSLEDKITIIKNPSREDVVSAYHQCKFLVLPSLWELSPLTPLEGFACKKTVISTTAHGIPYTIKNDENCILVPPDDSKTLAEKILFLIKNDNFREILENNAYNLVKNERNIDVMINQYSQVYHNLIESKKKA